MATKNHRGWGTIRKLPSGRFQASYIGLDMRRHNAPTTYSMRLRAEGWLSQQRAAIELNTWKPPESTRLAPLTLADYGKQWIAQRPLKPRSRIGHEDTFRLHIEPVLGEVGIGELTTQIVRRWYASLGTETPTSNAHAYGLLHSICNTAVKDGLIERNPCQIDKASTPIRKREPVILDIAEIATLADAVTERFKAMILLSAWTGVRWGEVTELRRSDISDSCEIVSVSRSVTRRNGLTLISTTKSGKARTVVIPPHIRADIKHHLDAHTHQHADSLLFANSKGDHLDAARFRASVFKPACESIGREGVTFHMLRHFAGTQIARVGNLVESMRVLGHSTVRASLLYQQVVNGRDSEIADALSQLAAE